MAENNKPTKSGRKPLVDEEVDLIFRKLEPYLKKLGFKQLVYQI